MTKAGNHGDRTGPTRGVVLLQATVLIHESASCSIPLRATLFALNGTVDDGIDIYRQRRSTLVGVRIYRNHCIMCRVGSLCVEEMYGKRDGLCLEEPRAELWII